MPAPTYLSLVEFPGDGVTTAWDFNFAGGYISRSHVKAWTRDANGVITDLTVVDGDFITDFRLTVAPAVPVGQTLRIYRDTPRAEPLVNFTGGSNFTEANLDLLARQAIFCTAEAFDAGAYILAVELLSEATAALAQATLALELSNSLDSSYFDIVTWATGEEYGPGIPGTVNRRSITLYDGTWYIAGVDHVAGPTFAGDLADGLWIATDAAQLAGDLQLTTPGKGGALVATPETAWFEESNVLIRTDTLRERSAGGIDVRYALEKLYGSSWAGHSAPHVGDDIGAAITYICDNSPARTPIWVPPGSFRMTAGPAPAKLSGRSVRGAGSQGSVIVYDNAGGAAFHFSGAGGLTGGGLDGLGILLEDGLGDTNAVAILLQGDATYQPDQIMLRDLYVSKADDPGIGVDSMWLNGLLVNGVSRTVPQGVRVGAIDNVQLFKCRNTGAYFSNIVQWTMSNLGVYVGAGSGRDILFAGGGASNTNSTQVHARGLYANDLNITNSYGFDITGTFSTVTTGPSATRGRIFGIGGTLVGSLGTGVTLSVV